MKSGDPRLRDLFDRFVEQAGPNVTQAGQTKFWPGWGNVGGSVDSQLLPLDLLQDLKTAVDRENRYLVKAVQLIRAPARRGVADPYMPRVDIPWRYNLLLLTSGQVVREPWTKVYGMGATQFPEAAYAKLRPAGATVRSRCSHRPTYI